MYGLLMQCFIVDIVSFWKFSLPGETWCPAGERKRSLAVGGYCAGSLALPAWLGHWVRPYGHRIRPGILDMRRSFVTLKVAYGLSSPNS